MFKIFSLSEVIINGDASRDDRVVFGLLPIYIVDFLLYLEQSFNQTLIVHVVRTGNHQCSCPNREAFLNSFQLLTTKKLNQ